MNAIIPFSEACERNKDVILEVITPYLKQMESVLEIGTGTAQHALYFAEQNPHLRWQSSDQTHYLDGIKSQLRNAKLANVLPPFELDVNQSPWLAEDKEFQGIFTANTLHIMSDNDVAAFFKGLPEVTGQGTYLMIYGPFKYHGKFTSDSNAQFDQSLRAREVGSCIKDFETVSELAALAGFELVADHKMPANNQCLIFENVRTVSV